MPSGPSRFRLTPTTTVFAIFHIGVVLLLLHYIAPKIPFHPILHAPLARHARTLTMSESSLNNDTPTNATSWIRSRLTALHEDVSSQDVFDRVFSPACEVRLNHAVHPLQTFKDELASMRAAATHVSVAWDAGEVVLTNDDKPDEPAVVAGVFVVTRSLPYRIRVSLAQRRTHVHFSAKIEQDPSVQDGDQRRITSFYYTSVDRTPPIHFRVPRAAQEGGSEGQ